VNDAFTQALVAASADLSVREKGVLVSACASTMGDSYCALAWGRRLSDAAGTEAAVGVLTGTDDGLSDAERTLAAWARKVTSDPNGTTPADVEELRAAGYDDARILALTVYVALRRAFSTVNDALGAVPDPQVRDAAPAAVRDAVTWGRQGEL
jgi:alkylhydroperoxidase family enzyme